jgi:hypothetical protein
MSNQEIQEEWRVINNFPEYEVSSHGRVRSWKPLFNTAAKPEYPRLMTVQPNGSGYPSVSLTAGSITRRFQVHVLVAEAFCPRSNPDYDLVRHDDGNPANCRASNLIWGTHAENTEDQFRHGRARYGERSPVARLKDEQAKEIFESGEPCSVLARKYGVSPSTISAIRTGRIRRRSGHSGASPGAVGMGGRVCAKKITAEIAREIFSSTETLRVLAQRHGISENFAHQIQIGRKWKRATAGLVRPARERAFYGRAPMSVSPLKSLTEEQVREIFLSPMIGRQIALKVGATEGHVSMIRARKVCELITKDLIAPDRPKAVKLDAEKARAIFQSTGPLKETADRFGVSFNMVSLIRRRCAWAHATQDLPDVSPVSVDRGEVVSGSPWLLGEPPSG